VHPAAGTIATAYLKIFTLMKAAISGYRLVSYYNIAR